LAQPLQQKKLEPIKVEQQIENLKVKRGRPSNASKALLEARAAGEALVVTTLDHWNQIVEANAVRINVGGRPSCSFQQAVQTLQNTNARLPGTKAQRIEESAATKLMMCEVMKENLKNYTNSLEWKKAMQLLYDRPWRALKQILKGEEVWRARVKELKLGKGTTGTLAAKGTCSKGKRFLQNKSRGCRSKGAGRKDVFKPIKHRLKAWLEKERSMCHHVDKTDLVEEFIDFCEDDLEDVLQEKRRRLEVKQENAEQPQNEGALVLSEGASNVTVLAGYEGLAGKAWSEVTSKELVEWEKLLKNRVQRLKASKKYFDSFGNKLLVNLGAKLLQPGRMSALSMQEEEARVKNSWKDFDAALWVAAFGTEEDLAKYVANPIEFQSCRQQLVIGFSDQIPVWVKIGRTKQVYCEREVQDRKTSKDFQVLQKKAMQALKDKVQKNEDILVNLNDLQVLDANQSLEKEGLDQTEEQAGNLFFSKLFSYYFGGVVNIGG